MDGCCLVSVRLHEQKNYAHVHVTTSVPLTCVAGLEALCVAAAPEVVLARVHHDGAVHHAELTEERRHRVPGKVPNQQSTIYANIRTMDSENTGWQVCFETAVFKIVAADQNVVGLRGHKPNLSPVPSMAYSITRIA